MMNKREFMREREPAWQRFEALLRRFSGTSLRKVRSRDVAEFSRLFRELANDLATVRSRGWGDDLGAFLNQLVSRGYNTFYRAPPGAVTRGVEFLLRGFPRLIRANLWYFIAGLALFFGPLGVSWAVVQNDPSLATRVLPRQALDGYKSMYRKRKDESEKEWGVRVGQERSAMAGFYINNNIGIAWASFARGALLGVGTVYTLLFNGIVIGTVAGFVVAEADSQRFLSFVITHGAFELTAISVAGAGGLVLGNAILHPGRRTRWEALRVRGLVAIQLAIGAGVMLFIAALIEAFWSPTMILNPSFSHAIKYFVGTVMWVAVFCYFALAGIGGDRPSLDTH
ncbi:MAG: stage II sporulation protein M [Planctomycetaceae bacterium]